MSGWASLSGYLLLKPGGRGLSILKTRKRLWCVLEESQGKLLYFKTEDDARSKPPLGYVELKGAAITLDIDNANQFVIIVDGKEILLTAENHESMMIWMMALQARRDQFAQAEQSKADDSPDKKQHLDLHESRERSSSDATAFIGSSRRNQALKSLDSHRLHKPLEVTRSLHNPDAPMHVLQPQSKHHSLSTKVLSDTMKPMPRTSVAYPWSSSSTSTDNSDELDGRKHQKVTRTRSVLMPDVMSVSMDANLLKEHTTPTLDRPQDDRVTELEQELISTKCELAKVINRQTCFQEILKQKDEIIEDLDGKLGSRSVRTQDSEGYDSKKRTASSHKDDQERVRVLQNQNRFLNEEVRRLAKLRSQEHDVNRGQLGAIYSLEADIEVWKLEYISLIQSSIRFTGTDTIDDAELCLFGGDRHKDRILDLLEAARKINPSLPTYDHLASGEVHVDSYGFKHQFADDGLLLHYLCIELSQHFLTQASSYEKHQKSWALFLKHNARNLFADKKSLKLLVRGGVPDPHRRLLWKTFVHAQVDDIMMEKGAHYYRSLCNAVPESPLAARYRKQISLDLMRTMPSNAKFCTPGTKGVIDLQDVLLAFCIHNPTVGYCQGMNFLVAMALLVMDPEDAFWTLVAVTERYHSPSYFDQHLLGAQADQSVLNDLMSEKMPHLAKHLGTIDIEISTVTLNWFLALFFDAVPFQTLLRIWDCFLLEGPKVLFRFSMAVLHIHSKEIIKKGDTISVMRHLKASARISYDTDGLIQVAYKKLKPFPRRQDIASKQAFYLNALREKFSWREMQRSTLIKADTLVSSNESQSEVLQGFECCAFIHPGLAWVAYVDPAGTRICVVDCLDLTMTDTNIMLDTRIMSMASLGAAGVVLGTLSWFICAYNQNTRELCWQQRVHDAVLSLQVYQEQEGADNSNFRLFAGLADGTVAVFETVSLSCKTYDPLYLPIGQSPVTCLQLLGNQLWCACGNTVAVIHACTLDSMDRITVSSNPYDIVLAMEPGLPGVWISVRGSTVLELWDPLTLSCKMLYDTKAMQPPNLKKDDESYFNSSRITSLLAVDYSVWVGTGEGTLSTFDVFVQDKTPSESPNFLSDAVAMIGQDASQWQAQCMAGSLNDSDSSFARILEVKKRVKDLFAKRQADEKKSQNKTEDDDEEEDNDTETEERKLFLLTKDGKEGIRKRRKSVENYVTNEDLKEMNKKRVDEKERKDLMKEGKAKLGKLNRFAKQRFKSNSVSESKGISKKEENLVEKANGESQKDSVISEGTQTCTDSVEFGSFTSHIPATSEEGKTNPNANPDNISRHHSTSSCSSHYFLDETVQDISQFLISDEAGENKESMMTHKDKCSVEAENDGQIEKNDGSHGNKDVSSTYNADDPTSRKSESQAATRGQRDVSKSEDSGICSFNEKCQDGMDNHQEAVVDSETHPHVSSSSEQTESAPAIEQNNVAADQNTAEGSATENLDENERSEEATKCCEVKTEATSDLDHAEVHAKEHEKGNVQRTASEEYDDVFREEEDANGSTSPNSVKYVSPGNKSSQSGLSNGHASKLERSKIPLRRSTRCRERQSTIKDISSGQSQEDSGVDKDCEKPRDSKKNEKRANVKKLIHNFSFSQEEDKMTKKAVNPVLDNNHHIRTKKTLSQTAGEQSDSSKGTNKRALERSSHSDDNTIAKIKVESNHDPQAIKTCKSVKPSSSPTYHSALSNGVCGSNDQHPENDVGNPRESCSDQENSDDDGLYFVPSVRSLTAKFEIVPNGKKTAKPSHRKNLKNGNVRRSKTFNNSSGRNSQPSLSNNAVISSVSNNSQSDHISTLRVCRLSSSGHSEPLSHEVCSSASPKMRESGKAKIKSDLKEKISGHSLSKKDKNLTTNNNSKELVKASHVQNGDFCDSDSEEIDEKEKIDTKFYGDSEEDSLVHEARVRSFKNSYAVASVRRKTRLEKTMEEEGEKSQNTRTDPSPDLIANTPEQKVATSEPTSSSVTSTSSKTSSSQSDRRLSSISSVSVYDNVQTRDPSAQWRLDYTNVHVDTDTESLAGSLDGDPVATGDSAAAAHAGAKSSQIFLRSLSTGSETREQQMSKFLQDTARTLASSNDNSEKAPSPTPSQPGGDATSASWSSYDEISTPPHDADDFPSKKNAQNALCFPRQSTYSLDSGSTSVASTVDLFYNVDLTLLSKNKISDKPVKWLLCTHLSGKPGVLSFSGGHADDEAVLFWSREANETLWTNSPVFAYNPKTGTSTLPRYMRSHLSSSSSARSSPRQRLASLNSN